MDWAEFDTPLYEEPLFYIEPKDKDKRSEITRQASFRKKLKNAIPNARAVAVPNAGKRGPKAIRTAKAEGMTAGFPDLIIIYQGRVAFFEFKNAKNMPTDAQIDFMNWLHRSGFKVACVRTPEKAFELLKEWGWPV